jgi:ABC-2 type transport system permease protein
MWRQVLALIVKELLAVLRDAKSRSVLISPPIVMLILFGYAATFDLDRVPIAIDNQDASEPSRDLVARFLGAPTFRLVATPHDSREIDALIDSRQIMLALVIDPRFTRDLLTGRPAPVQAILDGRNSNAALLIEGYANAILSDFSTAWAAAHGEPNPPATLDIRARYNPTLSSHWFFVPSIVALLTQIVTLMVVALSVARERESGTFDQLLVTPLRPIDILLGKGLPGVLIGAIEASAIIAATVWWFEVPLRGGLPTLYLGLLVFVVAVVGVGLMISALAATQQQALLGVFLFMVPSVMLSGFANPIANMPDWVQAITLINPMRYFLVIVRGVFLEGADVSSLAPQYGPMAAIAAVTLTSAAWLFRRRTT